MATREVTKGNFDKIVNENDIVVLDFWAQWCGPCKSFEPIFEKVSEQYPDVVFGKIDTESEVQLAEDFAIRQIPTIMILRERIAVFSEPGTLPASALADLVEQTKALDMDQVRAEIEENS